MDINADMETDTNKEMDTDTKTDTDIDTGLKLESFVRYPHSAIVPIVPYGLPVTNHGAISIGAINL
jgi:hypothetical protein